MKSLLENDLPAFYGVGRRCICDENTTSLSEFGRTRQTLWRAVQMLTQKLSCQTIHDCPKVVPLHYESEWQ